MPNKRRQAFVSYLQLTLSLNLVYSTAQEYIEREYIFTPPCILWVYQFANCVMLVLLQDLVFTSVLSASIPQ